jgi:protein TonB
MRCAVLMLIAAAIPLRSDVINRTPVVIEKTDPEYTEEARNAKVEGAVVLQVEIATDGRARNIHVVKSLGYGLDEKAIECVRQWRFRPGVKHGTRVRMPAMIEVNFHLKNSRPKRPAANQA